MNLKNLVLAAVVAGMAVSTASANEATDFDPRLYIGAGAGWHVSDPDSTGNVDVDDEDDDVAIMGIVSGARSYCGLNWQQGFAQFIQIAAQNGWDVTAIAEEHGRFMGGARRSLQEAGYQCNANDLQTLEAIYP